MKREKYLLLFEKVVYCKIEYNKFQNINKFATEEGRFYEIERRSHAIEDVFHLSLSVPSVENSE